MSNDSNDIFVDDTAAKLATDSLPPRERQADDFGTERKIEQLQTTVRKNRLLEINRLQITNRYVAYVDFSRQNYSLS